MPGPYGLTSTGFNAKSLQEIKTDLETAWRSVFGAGADVSADSVDGQIIGIVADRMSDLWQLAAALYAAAYPDSATGVEMDKVAGITGTTRQPATKSQVAVTFTGTPATAIPTGTRVSVIGQGTLFEVTSGFTISGGGSSTVTVSAVETGPKYAPAGTVTVIETPVSGLASVTNALDQSVLGRDVETDPQLRIRRELDLRQIGASAVDAIRAGVLSLAGVTFASVTENVTDFTVDGIGPHGFEVVVLGGLDVAIAQMIWDRKPAGGRAYGSTSSTATDAIGGGHDMPFSRPTTLNGYVTVAVTVNAGAPENVGTVIAAAIVAYGDLNLTVASPLVAQALVPSIFAAAQGIVDVPSQPKIGTAPAPTLSTTITPTRRQIIDLDTSRVVVNVTRI